MAEILNDEGLTFDDVLLVPHYSEVTPDMTSIKTKLTNNFMLNIPFLSAAMDTVTESRMAIALALSGGLGIVHKNMSCQEQISEIEKVKRNEVVLKDYPNALLDNENKLCVGAAIGITDDMMERLEALMKAGANVFVLDSAHGDSKNVINATKKIKAKFSNLELIVGNVATYEGARDLMKAGASAVKVGMGPGSICTTRIIAGIGVPQLTAIMDCVKASKEFGIPIIADGGIRTSGDVVKALAAGADSVMLGGLFASCEEAPGEIFERQGKRYRVYRGMGSSEAMSQGSADRYFQSKHKKFVAEGIQGEVEVVGNVNDLLFQLCGGIKSGMGYCGASTIEELQSNAKFLRISHNSLVESFPHNLTNEKDEPNYKAKKQ